VIPSTLTWEIARAGGFMAYGLLTASVAIGLVVSLKWRSPRWTRFITTELHRFVTLLALVFTAIHTVMVAIDPFIGFSPAEVLVPFLSHYRPLWIALGIVATYLLIAVYLSERIRPYVGYEWWRRFHELSFAIFGLALVHGIATGSDVRTPWAIAIYAGSVVLVGALVLVRAFPPTEERAHPIPAAGALVAVLAIGLWAWLGPLQPGWNAVANNGQGSGNAILDAAGASPSAGPVVPSTAPSPLPQRQPFSDTISGQLEQGDNGSAALTAVLSSSGDRLTLRFPSVQGGRLAINGATMSLLAPNGDTCTGPIQGLDDSGLTATCQGASTGSMWSIRMSLTQDSQGLVNGTIEADPQ
jgi:DMSO/TMAO reductase YedYZ heme-binding membrane subunit